jgi:hypothetical protein
MPERDSMSLDEKLARFAGQRPTREQWEALNRELTTAERRELRCMSELGALPWDTAQGWDLVSVPDLDKGGTSPADSGSPESKSST